MDVFKRVPTGEDSDDEEMCESNRLTLTSPEVACDERDLNRWYRRGKSGLAVLAIMGMVAIVGLAFRNGQSAPNDPTGALEKFEDGTSDHTPLLKLNEEAFESPYTVILDCGSSHTSMFVYKVEEDKNVLVDWTDTKKCEETIKIKDKEKTIKKKCANAFTSGDPLSNYLENPAGAGPMIGELVYQSQAWVPSDWRNKKTPLYIGATAGMRLLPTDKVRDVWHSVRDYLRKNKTANPYGFNFGLHAKNIPGNYEGVYQYLTVQNILNKDRIELGHHLKKSALSGIMEMGGASLQVTFKPTVALNEDAVTFYIDQSRITIFSKSYLGFGSNAAMSSYQQLLAKAHPSADSIDAPCIFKGDKWKDVPVTVDKKERNITFVGTGEPDKCAISVRKLLYLDYVCPQEPCGIMGEYQPPPKKFGKMIGISGFFYVAYNSGLVGWTEAKVIEPKTIRESGHAVCKVSWAQLQEDGKTEKPPFGPAFHDSGADKYKQQCFNSILVSELLNAFGYAEDDKSIIYTRKLASPPLGGGHGEALEWTRGATLFQTQYMQAHKTA